PLTTSDREVVAALGRAIASRIGQPRFQFWFEPNTKFRWNDGLLSVGVPNLHLQEYLEGKFGDVVRAAAGDVFGRPVPVRFFIDPQLFQAARRAQASAERDPVGADNRDSSAASAQLTGKTPAAQRTPRSVPQRRWRRLGDFVVGACNRLAHAAALN